MKKMKLLGLLIWAPIGTVYSGFILTKLWSWFLVPYGLKPINLIIAIGISLIMSQIKGYRKVKTDDVDVLYFILGTIVYNTILLLVGFIFNLFM